MGNGMGNAVDLTRNIRACCDAWSLMSELQEMSEDAFDVDHQIAQLTERILAIYEHEFEWAQTEGNRARLTELLEVARATEQFVNEDGPLAGASAGLPGRASRLVSRIVASLDGASSR